MYIIENESGGIGKVEGRNIVKSYGIGKWNPEDVHALTVELLKLAKTFGTARWAYIADPTKMDPLLSKETSQAFIDLHVSLEQAGCNAVAFLDGKTAAMKMQSQRHANKSNAELQTTHIKSEEEALEWLADLGI